MGIIRRHGGWIAFVVAVIALLWPRFAPRETVVSVPCQDIIAGCQLPETDASIRFDHQPDALKPFTLFVVWPDAQEIHASFQMRDMQMGFNRYALVAQEVGHWRAEVMLPACIQGRKDWLVELEVGGVKYEVPFSSR